MTNAIAGTTHYILVEYPEGYRIVNRKNYIVEYTGSQLGSCLYQMKAMEGVLLKAIEEGLYAT